MTKCPRSHPTADIVVRDQWAYIAKTWGLRVLNIANPKNIYENSHRGFPNGARRLTLNNDNYLYVADGMSGLLVYDIRQQWNPQLVGSGYDTSPAAAIGVAVQDNYVYLVEEDHLQLVDVNRKNNLAAVGGYTPMP